MSKKSNQHDNSIALNRKATHDYFIEERLEAGIVLEGWEVKSLRAGRVQIAESYVILKQGELWWLGGLITPLPSAAQHLKMDPQRTRKLLLHAKEIGKLSGKIDQKGYTVVPLRLCWKKGFAKLEIGLAKGKKQHDKRQTTKNRDWEREKARQLRK